MSWPKYKALLTERDREHLREDDGQGRYQATTRVRKRITESLPRDIEFLSNHHPELLDELVLVVCDQSRHESTYHQAAEIIESGDPLTDSEELAEEIQELRSEIAERLRKLGHLAQNQMED